MWVGGVVGQAVVVCDYIILSLLVTMALCCTLAVVGSSCTSQVTTKEGVTRTGHSYVTRDGGTVLVSDNSQLFTV